MQFRNFALVLWEEHYCLIGMAKLVSTHPLYVVCGAFNFFLISRIPGAMKVQFNFLFFYRFWKISQAKITLYAHSSALTLHLVATSDS